MVEREIWLDFDMCVCVFVCLLVCVRMAVCMCALQRTHPFHPRLTYAHIHAAIRKNGREGLVFPVLGWVGLLVYAYDAAI